MAFGTAAARPGEPPRIAFAHALVAALLGAIAAAPPSSAATLAFPVGATLEQDLFIGSFVDLDPDANELLTFACNDWTRDGHRGLDFELRTFDEQAIGVPVFAAADGVVTFVEQSDPNDANTSGSASPGNRVYVDHGDGVETQYWHLRHASVPVTVGQAVAAGEPLGLVGSSGQSFGPHLHFEVLENGQVVEPYAGACNPGPSRFTVQPALELAVYLNDFGVTDDDLTNPAAPFFPFGPPRDAQLPVGVPFYFWMRGGNLAAGATAHVVVRQPDASVWVDDTFALGSGAFERRFQRWIGGYFLGFATGTWTIELSLDGAPVVAAPFEVVDTVDPLFNRPPEPISAALSPSPLTTTAPLRCAVVGDALLDDLDWDVVRYRYVWRVDGAVERDVVSAGRSDVLARGVAGAGQIVRCDVTPNDGKVDGATASAEARVAAAVPAVGSGLGALAGAALAGLGAMRARRAVHPKRGGGAGGRPGA
ncbi:MAG: M23 family metallopeptidase [Myxococcota bacterium]